MHVRPTQLSSFDQVRRGLLYNLARLVRAQDQVATGLRIQRPSDDPLGAARAVSYARRLHGAERYRAAAEEGRSRLDLAATRVQDAADVLGEARGLLLQGMNGTLGADDRRVLAEQVRVLRERLLEVANARGPEGYLFDGTQGATQPFKSLAVHGRERVVYAGTGQAPELLVGDGLVVQTGLPGSDVFTRVQRSGTHYGGFTGVAAGSGGDVGSGSAYLRLRHEETGGTLGGGVTLASSGSKDTILGTHALVVDAAAGTVQLDGGKALALPQPGDPDLGDFTVTNEHGAEVHLDFSAFSGEGFSATLEGSGSISLDGQSWVALDFSASDLELTDPATGTRLSVDTRGIHRAGSELVVFGGAVNAFDALQGIADDLDNLDGLPSDALVERLTLWLGELERNQENVLGALGVLGGRSSRLTGVLDRLGDEAADLAGRRSKLVDTDYSEAALEMARAEQALQLAQATGSRLLSTTLLDFLR